MSNLMVAAREGILQVTLNRPEVRNAVDAATADELYDAFGAFEADDTLRVAVLSRAGGNFCAGADLKAIAKGELNPVAEEGCAPMGPTRLQLSKPVIAAVEGYAVAGGLELALWCDLRVAARGATFGVFSRRLGVPLIDLGTVRLPRLIGMSRALDLILTGRAVQAKEAFEIGLANRLCATGTALDTAMELAGELAQFPQQCLRADRAAVYAQANLMWEDAWRNELRGGLQVIAAGETRDGVERFERGEGRHGRRHE